MEGIRSSYRSYIAAMLRLAGMDDADSKTTEVFDLERRIAAVHWTRTESEDVLKANNPWKRADFARRAPGLDWPTFFEAAGLKDAPAFNVWQPSAITGISALVARQPLSAWRSYLTFEVINHNAYLLPKAFVDERFAFYGKVLSGTPELRARWKRASDSTSDAMPEAVGKLYVQRYFPADAKAKVLAIVKDLETAFGQRIDSLTWMNAKTKTSAKAKLATLRVGIGYPDTWRDYSSLEIVRGDAFLNAWRAELFDYRHNIHKLGHPVDRDRMVDCAADRQCVEPAGAERAEFPGRGAGAAVLRSRGRPSVQYGTIGTIIGHEISHSFDDQGSQFDAEGRLANWWTPEDLAHFKAASAKLVAQYDAYQPFPDLHVNGRQTLGENIADLAGLSAAYDAYHLSQGRQSPAPRDGFTADQRFFIGFGQNWRDKTREPALRQRILTDGHPPDEYRADTVRNIDAWYEAFDAKPPQRLYLPRPDRVRVW